MPQNVEFAKHFSDKMGNSSHNDKKTQEQDQADGIKSSTPRSQNSKGVDRPSAKTSLRALFDFLNDLTNVSNGLIVAFVSLVAAVTWIGHHCKNWLSTTIPFGSIGQPKNDGHDWIVYVGTYLAVFALFVGIVVACNLLWLVSRYRVQGHGWQLGWHGWIQKIRAMVFREVPANCTFGDGPIESVYTAIGRSYVMRRYKNQMRLQLGIRMLFLIAVVISALNSLGHRGDTLYSQQGQVIPSSDSISLVVELHTAQIITCAIYFILATCLHLYDCAIAKQVHDKESKLRESLQESYREHRRSSDSSVSSKTISTILPNAVESFHRALWQNENLIGKRLWYSALLDWLMITIVWSMTITPGRDFYLGYLIPMTGTWLFFNGGSRRLERKSRPFLSQHAKVMFALIAFAVVVRTAIVLVVRFGNDEVYNALHTKTVDHIWLALGHLIPKLAFFGVVAMSLATLRYLRTVLGTKVQRSEHIIEQEKSRRIKREEQLGQESHRLYLSEQLNAERQQVINEQEENIKKTAELISQLSALKAAKQTEYEHLFTKTEDLQKKLQNEAFLKKALAKLGASQDHAVFIKDVHRRFLYANEILLKRITPILQGNVHSVNSAKVELVALPKNVDARIEDLMNRTDAELGIEHKDYIESDEIVLGLNGHGQMAANWIISPETSSDHWQGFEHSFEQPEGSAKSFWTIKQAIRDDDDHTKILGLIGEVLPGPPEELRRLTAQIASNLPIFASMKDEDGYVVFMNEQHLNKLKCTLLKGVQSSNLSPGSHLRSFNNGRGPTDVDLYGEEIAAEYRLMDIAIENAANDYINNRKRIEESKPNSISKEECDYWILAAVLNRIPLIREKGVTNYPSSGWTEYHCFPNDQIGSWVEVRKWPNIVEHEREGRIVREFKGILVIFADITRIHLRKSVVWHWVEQHLMDGRHASAFVISKSKRKDDWEDLCKPESLPLLRMLLRMLCWTREVIDGIPLTWEHGIHSSSELNVLMTLLSKRYDGISKVSVLLKNWPVDIKFPKQGYELFGIITALVMNAIEATLYGKRVGDHSKEVTVMFTASRDRSALRVSIVDHGRGFDGIEGEKINRLQKLRFDEKTKQHVPGGGLILARGLARRLSAIEEPMITSPGLNLGAQASFAIPFAAFSNDGKVLSDHFS